MPLKRDREGYVLIDNRLAPPEPGVTRFFEGAAITCNHCQRQVLRDPGAQHDRYWCAVCDSYLCKSCKALSMVAGCKPFTAVIEEFDRLAHKGMIF